MNYRQKHFTSEVLGKLLGSCFLARSHLYFMTYVYSQHYLSKNSPTLNSFYSNVCTTGHIVLDRILGRQVEPTRIDLIIVITRTIPNNIIPMVPQWLWNFNLVGRIMNLDCPFLIREPSLFVVHPVFIIISFFVGKLKMGKNYKNIICFECSVITKLMQL